MHEARPESLNWTKVGLKALNGWPAVFDSDCLNWTKVGLKDQVGAP